MMRFTPAVVRHILALEPGYQDLRVAIETGTYEGRGTETLAAVFPNVHTIELSPVLAQAAKTLFAKRHPGVTCHEGDSRVLLPRLLEVLKEPAFICLDAHWGDYDARMAGADRPIPLWDELAVLASRPPGDVILIDDVRCFGRHFPTEDWREITCARIEMALPHKRSRIFHDLYMVLYR